MITGTRDPDQTTCQMHVPTLLRTALILAARRAGDLQAAGACHERVQVQLTEAQQQAADAAVEASQYERKAALLSAECDGLKRIVAAQKSDVTRARAASGRVEDPDAHSDVDRATTRVVHMVHNPESLARREAEEARFAMLQAENAALRTQLARLEATAAPAKTPPADSQSQNAAPASPAADGATALALAQAEVAVLKSKVSPVCSVNSDVPPRASPLPTPAELIPETPAYPRRHTVSYIPTCFATRPRCEQWRSASSG